MVPISIHYIWASPLRRFKESRGQTPTPLPARLLARRQLDLANHIRSQKSLDHRPALEFRLPLIVKPRFPDLKSKGGREICPKLVFDSIVFVFKKNLLDAIPDIQNVRVELIDVFEVPAFLDFRVNIETGIRAIFLNPFPNMRPEVGYDEKEIRPA